MRPQGALMIEHRLIERMISIIAKTLEQIKKQRKVDPVFIDTAVDFIRIYADQTHHGKEENILFRNLADKNLSPEDKNMMEELIDEHVFARKTTKALAEANSRYSDGDTAAVTEIIEKMKTLVDFYPGHIEKEDKIFFPASRAYFSQQLEQSMLDEFWEFDRQMIHNKYQNLTERLENA